MALTNPQYDAIMRMYNERQLRHQREQQEHIRIAYEKIPRLAEIDAEIASVTVPRNARRSFPCTATRQTISS